MSFASGSSQSAIANGCGYGYGYQLTSIAEVQGSATGNKIYRLLTNPPAVHRADLLGCNAYGGRRRNTLLRNVKCHGAAHWARIEGNSTRPESAMGHKAICTLIGFG
jgi:hypothetical protein